jgi:PTS system mannose-specific IID component
MSEKTTKTNTEENNLISKSIRRKVWWRLGFEQGSWNFERMHNLGFAYIMAPVIKKLYPKKEDQISALKRHLEFFNTHPYVAAPIVGVTMAMEEAKAKGEPVDDAAINGVKVGMMGPLAGVGDPIFWGTIRPVLGAFAASFAATGSIAAPIIFFVVWNIIRMAFLWYTEELGYKQGTNITSDLGALQKLTYGASILGMFIMGVLVPRWTTMKFPAVLSTAKTADNVTQPFTQTVNSLINTISGNGTGTEKAKAITDLKNTVDGFPGFTKDTTVQSVLDQILPGLGPLLLLFLTIFLLRHKVSPIVIILGYFVLGVLAYVLGILGK